MGGGVPLPSRLGCLGERRKLPQREFWCILRLKEPIWLAVSFLLHVKYPLSYRIVTNLLFLTLYVTQKLPYFEN